ncbi:MAG: 3-deoxy-manno-octulosonate cytidylyltransferase [Planctomycetota bacterium]|nr:3-deoxy-manno-octulosonate cytidylyltransferase [Planctomycetota bacterium]
MPAAPYAILIPARLGSERLPQKVLLRESGKYLVQHVYERAAAAPGAPRVLVLTDDGRVEEAVRSFGGEVLRTRADHTSGSDRCAEAAATLTEAVVVNVQGDEPLLHPADLGALAEAAAQPGTDIATLGWPFEDAAAMEDPHAVKAVRGPDGFALGFTRQAARARALGGEILHHVGIYAFRRTRLLEFPGLPRTAGEREERLEQLRALEHGWLIAVLDASAPAFGIDVRADYDRFLAQQRGI